ncbi:glutaredoxin 3 [Coxiella burnetii]|uniref:Glutaredoxin n=2 Tax=Coxiella burnetii TaxID=777 RepID=Q83BI8_COXBU|nr:glutaredoxin 3 [Coxiella burnetii]NP_820503.1 glutaredoxin [Coxiella burnetii RSA 493]AAO91017.1 glutaredoxin [Coxiella burnetii RSA 493]ABS76981.1 glutaredoxin [Coxiella burnetii Dugway 5J108-111]ABX78744.1 glutaredoxin 3 [Coxiella burnetii RSA 331]ACJ17911.1 glutaredoxin [Coxiella burnetii CbuG_Q212]ACJ20880.1 glutaredoxin [Coxiella burnetii CbuK_Q154]
MAKIEIYTTARCPYCVRAKALLDRKGLDYMEIRIDEAPEKRDEMLSRSEGRRTVPQIFINGRGIGGFDELWELEQSKKLDELLKT